jgi:hypothetical protein
MNPDRMLATEKDQLAARAMEHLAECQESLSSHKRSYPTRKFEIFWSAAKRYAELLDADDGKRGHPIPCCSEHSMIYRIDTPRSFRRRM